MEAPHLQRLHREYEGRGVRVIGVTPLSAPLSEVREFVARHGITYPTLADPEGRVMRRYGDGTYPLTVVIDRRQAVRYSHTGFRAGDEDALEGAVVAAL